MKYLFAMWYGDKDGNYSISKINDFYKVVTVLDLKYYLQYESVFTANSNFVDIWEHRILQFACSKLY